MEIGQTYGLGDVLTQVSQTQPSQTQNTSYNASSLMDQSMMGGSLSQQQEQQPILEISREDMEEFYRTLTKKEDDLREALNHHRKTRQEQEDHLQAQLTDLHSKLKSIDNERGKLNTEQTEARKELTSNNSQVSTMSRVRKSDIDDAKRRAENSAKD